MNVDLTLSADSVRFLVQKARAAASRMDDAFEDGHEGDIEFDQDTLEKSHHHDGLAEEENDDSTEEELRELINDLNVDEISELIAIIWIGRGDFEPDDLATAIEAAKDRSLASAADYLTKMPMFADHLESGLDALEL